MRDLDLRQAVLFVGHQFGLQIRPRRVLPSTSAISSSSFKDLTKLDVMFCKHAVLARKCIEQHVQQSLVVAEPAAKSLRIVLVFDRLFERLCKFAALDGLAVRVDLDVVRVPFASGNGTSIFRP